jgi:predicted deacylase
VQKLGQNSGGYQGEVIDITAVLHDIEDAARRTGWLFEPIPVTERFELHTWHRQTAATVARFYISAGIHGDEPAGPLAVRQLMRENEWPPDVEIWLCPCLNPTGFPLNRRESADGFDLNRQYLHVEAAETRAHIEWLQRQPRFDLTLCLHEDWEADGFYLYELNPDERHSHAAEIIQRVSKVCPIDPSAEIEGRAASGGIIRPSVDPLSRPHWPEALWLLQNKTRHSYTLEAPSDFPLETRVAALVAAVRTVLAASNA